MKAAERTYQSRTRRNGSSNKPKFGHILIAGRKSGPGLGKLCINLALLKRSKCYLGMSVANSP